MKTSAAGRKLIEDFEGLILQSYDDADDRRVGPGDHVYGTLTIGYGHTSAAGLPHVYPGMVISAGQADAILASDLAGVEADVYHLVKVGINQNQFDALVSFDFNTGALGRSNVLRSINAGDFAAVPGDLMMWVHARGITLPGLVRRRRAEAQLFMRPMPGTPTELGYKLKREPTLPFLGHAKLKQEGRVVRFDNGQQKRRRRKRGKAK